MSSRPLRPSALGAAPAPERPNPDRQVGGADTSFEALRNAHDTLVRQRSRLELLHEQAQNEIKACQEEARKLGVQSIEELEALIRKQEEEDRQALESFQEAIQAEEALQKRVISELDAIGN